MDRENNVETKRYDKLKKQRKIFLILLILGIFVMFLVFKTSFLNIKKIRITGNSIVTDKKILNDSQIVKGDKIYKVNSRDVEKNLRNIPYIKDVKVRKKYPNIVEINIFERIKKAQIKVDEGFLIIDKDGFVLDIIDEKENSIPVIYNFINKKLKAGTNIYNINKNQDFETFIKKASDLNVLGKFTSVELKKKELKLKTFDDSCDIKFGMINDKMEYKLKLLSEIIIDLENKDINCKEIILNKGDNPIIKRR